MQFLMLFHLPFSNVWSDHYSLSRFKKRVTLFVIWQQLNK